QVHQVQTKFRNEKRAKSGLLRGREFRMKDMYSFHESYDDLDAFYEKAIHAYNQVFNRCGLGEITLLTYASGGVFSKECSHEFQVITPYGEDIIYRLPGTKLAINKEIIDDQNALTEFIPDYYPGKEKELEELKGIEVGNIFKIGNRYTHAFGATYMDKEGSEREIVSGCYGIGTTRLMGAIAECLSDDRGLVWPEEVAPFHIQLTSLGRSEADILKCERVYDNLTRMGAKVLYDDRRDLGAGNKLADADLLGMPHRIIVSPKTIAQNVVEWTKRDSGETQLISLDAFKVEFMKNKCLTPTLTSLNRLGTKSDSMLEEPHQDSGYRR
ncbi:MAG TPA: aminoacyl--tRNA ligase-related protein, partial [Candidatus Baltobacteraceae bacterium]|nr:aminoacyl--tRNA ligase-related protein [Candidatus Baltobacteraceae bacterium]